MTRPVSVPVTPSVPPARPATSGQLEAAKKRRELLVMSGLPLDFGDR